MTDIRVNGHPVVISAHLVTGGMPGDDWKGAEFAGEYEDMKALNADMPRLIQLLGTRSIHWRLEFDFQDAE